MERGGCCFAVLKYLWLLGRLFIEIFAVVSKLLRLVKKLNLVSCYVSLLCIVQEGPARGDQQRGDHVDKYTPLVWPEVLVCVALVVVVCSCAA